MEDFEKGYNTAREHILQDRKLNSLKSIKDNLEKALSGINETIGEEKANIVIAYGLGYRGNESLEKAFPDTIDSRERVNGVMIVTRTAKDSTQNKFYSSRELKIFIKGEPEKREDGLYCRITGTNLSKL